jgi:Rieske Fe-S protein
MGQESNGGSGRRSFLTQLNLLFGGLAAAAVAIPGLGYLLHPLRKNPISIQEGMSPLGAVNSFKMGQPQKVAINAARRDAWLTTPEVTIGAVWVVRSEEEAPEFTILSTICPHLGCPIAKAQKGFHCPCHNSRFEENGELIKDEGAANPSPRAMDSLEYRIENGVLLCRYQVFVPGRPEKSALKGA